MKKRGGKLVLPPSTFQSGLGDCPQLLFPWSGEVRTANSYGASEFMSVRSFSGVCVAQSSVFSVFVIICQPLNICLFVIPVYLYHILLMQYSNMTSFKRFESTPVVKIILIYDRLNLWRHRQFIAIFYQSLHIRIEIIHGSHMYILFLPLANARGKTSWHKRLPVVKTIYTYWLPWIIS
jgi:hypothetical protein